MEGPKSIFTFFAVSYRGEWQRPGTFFGMKKYYSLPKLSNFELSKIHIKISNYIVRADFNRDLPKIFLKPLLFLHFLKYYKSAF